MKKWHDQGAPIRVAVNLSARQLRDRKLPALVSRILVETGVVPNALELEITESAVVDDWESAGATLFELKALGVHLCLDDFGTGYSSLSYLNRIPVSKLKIDRSFLDKMGSGSRHAGIVRTILNLAESLRMEVVAEGVETENQLTQLKEMECPLAQGYLFAKPLEVEAVESLLKHTFRQPPLGVPEFRKTTGELPALLRP